MGDFDGFEDNFGQSEMNDDDPAADFLAREQDELAGLEDENFISNGDTIDPGRLSSFFI